MSFLNWITGCGDQTPSHGGTPDDKIDDGSHDYGSNESTSESSSDSSDE